MSLLLQSQAKVAPDSGMYGESSSAEESSDTFTIDIQINYNWNIDETIEIYIISYEYVWDSIKNMIQQSEHEVEHIHDETSNKQNLVYTPSKAQMLFENQLTETWSMEIVVEVLTDGMIESYVTDGILASEIKQKYDQHGGLLNIVNVTCSIERHFTPAEIVGIVIGSLFGACCLCWCIGKCVLCYNNKRYGIVRNGKVPSPSKYINDPKCIKDNHSDPFIDGLYYGSSYKQGSIPIRKINILKDFQLKFKDGNVSGKGRDDVGRYRIGGTYSTKTQRMALYKHYIDLTYTSVKIRIEYNSETGEFEGHSYHDNGTCGIFTIKRSVEDNADIKENQKDYDAVNIDDTSESNHAEEVICSSELFINDLKYIKYHDHESNNPFIDGAYCGYYKDSRKYYDMNEFLITFMDGIVTGYGNDTIGDYDIKGIYSDKTQRMVFDQIYINSPGDSLMMRLEYHQDKQQFKGKWHGKEDKYESEGQLIVIKRKNTESEDQKSKSMVANVNEDITYC